MSEHLDKDEIRKWHRWFAAECNHLSWKLIERPERTAAEDRQMLHAAYSAAFHWSMVGTPLQDVRAELTLSRVHALLGHGTDALRYAQRCLAYCDNNLCEDWDIALGYVAMAHAAALLSDNQTHAEYYRAAEQKVSQIQSEANRRIVEAELTRVPRPE